MNAGNRTLPQLLYRAADVRALDRIAIEDCGIGGAALMERAGAAAFALLQQQWPQARRIAVLCGGGNNGGDGYVLARLAHAAGLDVSVHPLTPVAALRGDARVAADKLLAAGVQPQAWHGDVLKQAGLVVDALLGTGLDREVQGELRTVIEAVNAAGLPVLALDIPSGLHADTGQELGLAVAATATITFIGLKQGLFTGAGPSLTGTVFYSDLDVPHEIFARVPPSSLRVTYATEKQALKRRSRTAHKGSFGHVLVIGGEAGYAGAARLAAEAAARTGAGLVSVATRAPQAAAICMARPELMVHAVEQVEHLSPLLDRATCIAIGPGLGQTEWSAQMLALAVEARLPLIADADALNLLAADPVKRTDWILTPHPGEAARLLGCATAEVQSDRFAAVHQLQERYGGIVVLKGSGSLIRDDRQETVLCDAGNPGMASGGMGDVLTGIIAGLVAQGLMLSVAARLGVCLHAAAADAAARDGERGMLAGDLMPWLRKLANPQ